MKKRYFYSRKIQKFYQKKILRKGDTITIRNS